MLARSTRVSAGSRKSFPRNRTEARSAGAPRFTPVATRTVAHRQRARLADRERARRRRAPHCLTGNNSPRLQ